MRSVDLHSRRPMAYAVNALLNLLLWLGAAGIAIGLADTLIRIHKG